MDTRNYHKITHSISKLLLREYKVAKETHHVVSTSFCYSL